MAKPNDPSNPRPTPDDPPPPPPADGPAGVPRATTIRCPSCGYDLSGTPVGGACPECGTPVAEAFERRRSAPPYSGYSITSLVLGILAALGSLGCACGSLMTVILGGLAIIFGLLARKEARLRGLDPHEDGMATAGLICGGVGFLLGLVMLVLSVSRHLF